MPTLYSVKTLINIIRTMPPSRAKHVQNFDSFVDVFSPRNGTQANKMVVLMAHAGPANVVNAVTNNPNWQRDLINLLRPLI